MPNLTSILNEQIRRLARREVTASTKVVRKATAQYRRVIAALWRQVADLTKRLAAVDKRLGVTTQVDAVRRLAPAAGQLPAMRQAMDAATWLRAWYDAHWRALAAVLYPDGGDDERE